jgi:acyl-coenzyme A thioesterase PaaI-like protein
MKLINLPPGQLKFILNIYPPYLGTGIRVDHISEDWKELRVSMHLRWYNRNAVGTHFGGSLYAMIDPHLMLLLMRLLGKDYLVWDRSAGIEFIKATKEKVWAEFMITDEVLEDIKAHTEQGEKYLAKFPVEIRDVGNELIAKGEKVIYIRKKQHSNENND